MMPSRQARQWAMCSFFVTGLFLLVWVFVDRTSDHWTCFWVGWACLALAIALAKAGSATEEPR